MNLQLSLTARQDLLEVLNFIERRSTSLSVRRRFFNAFQETTALLALYPRMGRRLTLEAGIPEEQGEVHMFVVRRFPKFLITYQIEENAVTVLRILHTARDPKLRLAEPS